jgi:photosystem II stability/assembly factor-like uncharacterized protein
MPPGEREPGTTSHVVPGSHIPGTVLVATGNHVFVMDAGQGTLTRAVGLERRLPTCLALDPHDPARAWAGSDGDGVVRSEDGGTSWFPSGLPDRRIMALAASPSAPGRLWAGTEPSEVWRSDDGGGSWRRAGDLGALPSSAEWSFPPRPETHHVRWIACHPEDDDRVWAAVEAGALIATRDGGRSWIDRAPGGPFDTHELAIHSADPDTLHVAAGDGYYVSPDGGRSWVSPMEGLEVGYLRSVALDPDRREVVLVSGASGPRRTYVAGRGADPDGRLFRREGGGPWSRVLDGWPDPPETIAPLLAAGVAPGQLWAADERGVHQSGDGGRSWRTVAAFPDPPRNLRGLVVG